MDILTLVLLVVGFVVLIKGADLLVDGSSAVAKKLGISEIVIGLTIVAFGTSAPELIVNVFASFQAKSEITFGNVVGSNLFNILFILGVSGLISPIVVNKNTTWKEIPYALLSAVLVFLMCNDPLFWKSTTGTVSRYDGAILLFFFILFLIYTFRIAKVEAPETPEIKEISLPKSAIFIILGLVGLVIGGKLIVDNAVLIAKGLGVSEKMISLTIIAGGTSLPELATSSVAAYKGRSDIAIGNIVGSNIFNVFFIFSVSALICPVTFDASYFQFSLYSLNLDLVVLMAASLLLFVFMFTGKKHLLDRWEAGLFLVAYIAYVTYLIIRK